MNSYLIPANSKSMRYPMNAVLVSFFLLLIVSPSTMGGAVFCLLPVATCSILVIPVPNYHNILIVLTELILFFYQRRNYKWEGWCYKDEYK